MPDLRVDWETRGDLLFPKASGGGRTKARAGDLAGDEPGRFDTWPWTDFVVPFVIEDDVAAPERVGLAMRAWANALPVRFVRWDPAAHRHFVHVVRGDRTAAVVGCRRIGAQPLWLHDDAAHADVVHELGHVLGLWHEQCRADRDDHVEIMHENLRGTPDDILLVLPRRLTIGTYDFASVMHYRLDAFARAPGLPTLRPRRPLPDGVVPGRWDRISQDDIAKLAMLYGV